MKKTNALHLRQNLGAILKLVEKPGSPVLIERNRLPAAVLISIEDYKKRFADRDADDMRKEVVKRILGARLKLPTGKSSLDLLHEVRK